MTIAGREVIYISKRENMAITKEYSRVTDTDRYDVFSIAPYGDKKGGWKYRSNFSTPSGAIKSIEQCIAIAKDCIVRYAV